MKALTITSPSFKHNQPIPSKFTCDGQDVNPPLNIQGVPPEAKDLALVVDDPDAPMGTWDHWIVWNIPPTTTTIGENTIPGTEGTNDFQKHHYGGPCPPSGTHRYYFKIYALDAKLDLAPDSRKQDLEGAMKGHIVAKGELIGLYSRR